MGDTFAAAFETTTPLVDICVRMLSACLFGFVIGIDRELRGRPAGLRTIMLTALAAATFAIIAIEMVSSFDAMDQARLDPIRVVEAITAGVAFLAAGTIIQARGDVIGLTTGASMWLAGAIGAACGAGYLAVAAIATTLVILILAPLLFLEKKMLTKKDDERAQS